MNDLDRLLIALDAQAPQWAVRNATQGELVDYALDHGRNQDRANRQLRERVAARITVAIRAALDVGLVMLPVVNRDVDELTLEPGQ